MKRKATVNSKPVYDLDAFFGRLLIVGHKRDISIADLFNYELVPVPPSLINDYVYGPFLLKLLVTVKIMCKKKVFQMCNKCCQGCSGEH